MKCYIFLLLFIVDNMDNFQEILTYTVPLKDMIHKLSANLNQQQKGVYYIGTRLILLGFANGV
jgi:hypothetical protein